MLSIQKVKIPLDFFDRIDYSIQGQRDKYVQVTKLFLVLTDLVYCFVAKRFAYVNYHIILSYIMCRKAKKTVYSEYPRDGK